jgi:hypothetical protein
VRRLVRCGGIFGCGRRCGPAVAASQGDGVESRGARQRRWHVGPGPGSWSGRVGRLPSRAAPIREPAPPRARRPSGGGTLPGRRCSAIRRRPNLAGAVSIPRTQGP